MTFYKLIKTLVFPDLSMEHLIQYERGVLHVRLYKNDHTICETGEVLTPVFDSRTQALAGFVPYTN